MTGRTSPSASLEISPAEVHRRLEAGESLSLVDCREEEEFALAFLEGAIKLPMSQIVDRCRDLDTAARPIVVICHHGVRSRHVAQWLREQGFPEALSMTGGIDRWSQEIDAAIPRY